MTKRRTLLLGLFLLLGDISVSNSARELGADVWQAPKNMSNHYFVSATDPGASNSNDGSRGKPWKTLSHAANEVGVLQTTGMRLLHIAGSLGVHLVCFWLLAPAGTPVIDRNSLADSHVDLFCFQDSGGAGYIPYK